MNHLCIINRILISLAILSLPWYVLRTTIVGVPTTLTEILIWLTIIFTVASKIISRQAWARPSRIWLVIAAGWLVAAILAALIAQFSLDSLGILKAYFITPLIFAYVVFDYIVQDKQAGQQHIISALCLVVAQVCLICLSQAVWGWPNIAPHELSQGRASATFNTANAVGLLIGPWLTGLLVWSAATARRVRHRYLGLLSVGLGV